jgi:glycerophosphoryl diester phosphodiesterase
MARSATWVAAAVLVVGCSSGSTTRSAAPCAPSPFQAAKTLVIAHAGGEGIGPANTLEAMRLSRPFADANDADVQITKDGVLVAIHDPTVDATTDGTGPVSDFTLAELQRLDAGAKFAGPDGSFPFRGRGVRIPTIEAVLTEFPDWRTSLEMKTGGDAPRALCDVLTRTGASDRVYVSSSDDAYIDAFKPLCPTVVTTVTDAMVPIMIAERAKPDSTWCSPAPIGQPPFDSTRGRPTRESLKWAHDHAMANYTWTIDDPADMRYLAELRIDGFYTRRPDIARKIVDDVTKQK